MLFKGNDKIMLQLKIMAILVFSNISSTSEKVLNIVMYSIKVEQIIDYSCVQ